MHQKNVLMKHVAGFQMQALRFIACNDSPYLLRELLSQHLNMLPIPQKRLLGKEVQVYQRA